MKSEIDQLVKAALSGTVLLLPLRGSDKFARDSGDLDYMVPAGKAVTACRLVAEAAIARGWFLAGFSDIGYLAQILLVLPNKNATDEAIKLDFFDGLRWYGVGTDDAGRLLFDNFVALECDTKKLAGAACFFQKILVVGQLSDRDWARVAATGADAKYLAAIAKSLRLPVTLSQIEMRGVTGVAKWRLRAASGGVTTPFSILIWFLCVIVVHLKFCSGFGRKSGLILSVSGLDGSGKSTLVERFIAAICKAGGEPPRAIHLLPAWIPMPHQIIRRQKTNKNYTRPYSEPPVSSLLNGSMRLFFYLFVFALSRLVLWVGVNQGRLIIMDRSFLDFASDLTRSRIPALSLPEWLLRSLMPCRQMFYLDTSPEEAVSRKGELSLLKARSLQLSYRTTCKTIGATSLNGDNAPDEVFKELLSYVSMEYLHRILGAEARE